MKTIKILSIIGVVLFSIVAIFYFLAIIYSRQYGLADNLFYLTYFANGPLFYLLILVLLYGAFYSIISLILANKERGYMIIRETAAVQNIDIADELVKLSELKDKGAITDQEFKIKKQEILSY